MSKVALTKLKVKLLRAGTPAYKIAAACDMHPYVLSRYATGQAPYKHEHLVALMEYFDCRQRDLVGYDTFEVD